MELKMQSEEIGHGRPVVLVPGGLTGWKSWEPHAQRLSANRRAIRVQLISVQYGLEGRRLPSDYSLTTESEALSNTLDDLELREPFDIVAWSFGAEISLDYALNHPDRVRTLTLIEPPAVWVLGGKRPDDEAFNRMQSMSMTIKDNVSVEQLIIFLHGAGIVPNDTDPKSLPPWPGWVLHRQSLLNTRASMEHMDDPKRLGGLHMPVLLVKGTGSAKWLHGVIDVLARDLPESRVIELPGGHAPQLASMERFLKELEEFQG
ncbi:MAG TPA: alpha/beta hydrolase [Methanomassiliicoccales archaeon]|jgi:pimeloyl-ACP methyl ester carboxylesterase